MKETTITVADDLRAIAAAGAELVESPLRERIRAAIARADSYPGPEHLERAAHRAIAGKDVRVTIPFESEWWAPEQRAFLEHAAEGGEITFARRAHDLRHLVAEDVLGVLDNTERYLERVREMFTLEPEPEGEVIDMQGDPILPEDFAPGGRIYERFNHGRDQRWGPQPVLELHGELTFENVRRAVDQQDIRYPFGRPDPNGFKVTRHEPGKPDRVAIWHPKKPRRDYLL